MCAENPKGTPDMEKAINLTFGDLIIVEIALVSYCKDLDLSMQSGQYISELLGKIEYQLAEIRAAAGTQLAPNAPGMDLKPNPGQ